MRRALRGQPAQLCELIAGAAELVVDDARQGHAGRARSGVLQGRHLADAVLRLPAILVGLPDLPEDRGVEAELEAAQHQQDRGVAGVVGFELRQQLVHCAARRPCGAPPLRWIRLAAGGG
ncbi:hypothetical protein G6F59_016690 [Rhizopus arrhizus]|nr:hypothetical protein G6F59_016690 [Rhizopus arrhizus]